MKPQVEQPEGAVFDSTAVIKSIGGAIKMIGEDEYEGVGVFFTDPDHTDLEDDFFDQRTNFWWDDVETKAVLYDHTMGLHPKAVEDGEEDEDIDIPPHLYRIGKVTKRWIADDGVHFQFKLSPTVQAFNEKLQQWEEMVDEEHQQWLRYIQKKLGEGKFNFSSDSVEHIVRRSEVPGKSAQHIDQWPLVFVSITPKAAHGKPRTITKVSPASAAVRATAMAVNNLMSSPAVALERARRADDDKPSPKQETPMKKKLRVKVSPSTVFATAKGLLMDNWPAFEDFDFALAAKTATMVEDDDEVKELGDEELEAPVEDATKEIEGELSAKVRPIAQQLADLYGGTLESAMAMIMQCGMDIQQSKMGAGGDATANADMLEEDATANFDEEEFATANFSEEDEEYATANFSEEDEYATANFDEEDEYATASLDEEDEEEGGGSVVKFNRAAFRAAMRSQQPGGFVTKQFNINKGAQPKVSLTRFLRGIVSNDPQARIWSYRQSRAASKALGLNPDSAGGYLAPPEQSSEVIKLLRERAVVLGLCTTLPMNGETLVVPKQTGGATVRWVGENSGLTASQQTFGAITLVAKKLSCLVQVSNELLADSDPDIDAFIRNDISEAVANEIDRVIIDGGGIGSEPRGVIGSGITSTPSTAVTTLADLINMVKRVEEAKVSKSGKWSWLMNAGGKAVLRQLKDEADHYIWTGSDGQGQQAAGSLPSTLLDFPWEQSEMFENGGDSKPRLLFGNWSDVIVGMRKSLEIRATDVAGTSFEDDQTWIRAILRMDVGIRYPESLELLTALDDA